MGYDVETINKLKEIDIDSEELIIENEIEEYTNIQNYIDSLDSELDKLNEGLVLGTEFQEVLAVAEDEVNTYGNITTETGLNIKDKYNKLLKYYGNDDTIIFRGVDEAYKKEFYNYIQENAEGRHWLRVLIDKLISFCRHIRNTISKYLTKIGYALIRQEVTANKLADYISTHLDIFKIDKWEFQIPYTTILGNFTICNTFDKAEIEKLISFSNGGFRGEELLNLFKRCIDKGDMSDFKIFKGIPIDYDIRKYFDNYRDAIVMPIDVSGVTGHALVSYKEDANTRVLHKKTFKIIPNPSMRDSLKTKGVLSREDMIYVLRLINIKTRYSKDKINSIYKGIKEIENILERIRVTSKDRKYISDVTNCGTLLMRSLSYSTRVGLYYNSFVIRMIGMMAKLYKKQNKTRQ